MCFPENLAVSVSAIAAAIAQGRSSEEIELMGAVFSQLGDTLSTISAARDFCESKQEQEQDQSGTEKP